MAMMDELPWIHDIYFPFHHQYKQVGGDLSGFTENGHWGKQRQVKQGSLRILTLPALLWKHDPFYEMSGVMFVK